jgi:hypothetical protein
MTKIKDVSVVAGCMHLPFTKPNMFKAFCQIIRDLPLTRLYLIGDIHDMHSISRHTRGQIHLPEYNLGKEYAETNKYLDQIDTAIGRRKIKKFYLWGNHEEWYKSNMSKVDQYKLGMDVIKSPTEACKYIQRGYTVNESYKRGYFELGDLRLIHGDYVNMHSAKKHLDVYKRNIMYAHTHTIQQYSDSGLVAYNIGALADFDHPVFNYATTGTRMRWENGFAVVYTDTDGKSHPYIIHWKDNKFVFNGKVYK